jgi:hypothetical protein
MFTDGVEVTKVVLDYDDEKNDQFHFKEQNLGRPARSQSLY